MTQFVWVCREGHNEELRYSIRSVVEHHPDAEIIVVGGKPNWYTGEFIPNTAKMPHKLAIVRNHLQKIVYHNRIADDFVLMNDDFFLLKPYENTYFSMGTIEWHAGLYGNHKSTYVDSLKRTGDILASMDKNTYSFETHTPMLFNKDFLAETIKFRGLWRSMYANMWYIEPEVIEKDVKIYNVDFQGRRFIEDWDYYNEIGVVSTHDSSFNRVKGRIHNMFPEPTRFEKGELND